MTRTLIDSRLSARLTPQFYPDRLTVQTSTVTRAAAGSQVKAWADDPSRTDLPCRIAPTGGGEVERTDQVLTNIDHRIGLASDYGITTEERIVCSVTPDGVAQTFDVILVETDSQAHATYLNVLVVE